MSQEKNAVSGATTTGKTGGTCTQSGLYKATDGRMEFIQYFTAGEKFFSFPGGDGQLKCTWTLMSKSVDGNRTTFNAVKVAAGAL
jgi:hypothetical protein